MLHLHSPEVTPPWVPYVITEVPALDPDSLASSPPATCSMRDLGRDNNPLCFCFFTDKAEIKLVLIGGVIVRSKRIN